MEKHCLSKSKRLLTNKEIEEYLQLAETPIKQKKYLEKLYTELWQEQVKN